MDVQDFGFPTDTITGRVQLAFREANGRIVSAWSASDGTLRFLAMLAALLGTNPARFYVFEEIDNGIHPSRVRLLLDLIEGQTAKGGTQVVTTTHSPDLLSMIGGRTFRSTSVICRRPDTEDAVVRPIADLPDAGRLRESQGLGRLHTSGWLGGRHPLRYRWRGRWRHMNVLVIPEDFRKDQYILKPLYTGRDFRSQ